MAEKEWRFTFEQKTAQKDKVGSSANNIVKSGAGDTKKSKEQDKDEKNEFVDSFVHKGVNKLEGAILSPINTMTGGIASPIYQSTKQLVTSGFSAGAIAGLTVTAISLGIQLVQKRLDELDREFATYKETARGLNNTDNALIRAGSVRQATYYTAVYNSGVKKRFDRS